MGHLLTIDVEGANRAWDCRGDPGRGLEKALDMFLDTAREAGVRATMFVLGDDAGSIAACLRRCAGEGHEIASHGMRHVPALGRPEGEFREDVSASKKLLEDIVQKPCRGYRAPWFSLRPDSRAAFDILAEQGYVYDSSLRVDLSEAAAAFVPAGMPVKEIPAPAAGIAGFRIGILGGMALRLLPLCAHIRLIGACERRRLQAMVYLHPYEWARAGASARGFGLRAARRRLLVSRTLPALKRLAQEVELRPIHGGLYG